MKHVSLLLLLNLMACEAFKPRGNIVDTGMSGPSGYEPDSNEDTESEEDTDSGEIQDTDTEEEVDPDALDCTAAPSSQDSLPQLECASGRLWDGDQLDDTTAGGFNFFTKAHYESREWYCETNFNGEYEGPERSYVFLHPGAGNCVIDLETRCADFDLIAIRMDVENDGCPEPNAYIGGADPCKMEATRGLGRDESLLLYENTASTGAVVPYIIIVEAPEPTEEWFRLTVECD